MRFIDPIKHIEDNLIHAKYCTWNKDELSFSTQYFVTLVYDNKLKKQLN